MLLRISQNSQENTCASPTKINLIGEYINCEIIDIALEQVQLIIPPHIKNVITLEIDLQFYNFS